MKFLHLLFVLSLLLFQVATGQRHVCEKKGGSCQKTSLPCPHGVLPITCGFYSTCCANKPPMIRDCGKYGGFCRVPQREKCPSGQEFPANCGINARCCKP